MIVDVCSGLLHLVTLSNTMKLVGCKSLGVQFLLRMVQHVHCSSRSNGNFVTVYGVWSIEFNIIQQLFSKIRLEGMYIRPSTL